jgi:hypothetical protein
VGQMQRAGRYLYVSFVRLATPKTWSQFRTTKRKGKSFTPLSSVSHIASQRSLFRATPNRCQLRSSSTVRLILLRHSFLLALMSPSNDVMGSSRSSLPAIPDLDQRQRLWNSTTQRDSHRGVTSLDGSKSPRSVIDHLFTSDSRPLPLAATTTILGSTIPTTTDEAIPHERVICPLMSHIHLRPRKSSRIWEQAMGPASLYSPNDTSAKEDSSSTRLSGNHARFPNEIFFPEL